MRYAALVFAAAVIDRIGMFFSASSNPHGALPPRACRPRLPRRLGVSAVRLGSLRVSPRSLRLSGEVLFLALPLAAAVVDRVAVVVGKTVITESEVLQEVRLTQFFNQQPLDVGPAARRAAADRLVDQQLIRNEMSTGSYPMPTDAEAADMLRKFQQENYPDAARFRAALEKYNLTEDDLKQHLLWQLAAIRFTDLRFQAGPTNASQQSANRLRPGAPLPAANDVDRQLESWLKESRGITRVQFKPGAFQ